MGKMGAKFLTRIKKIEAQINTFNSQHPQVEAELTYRKITEILPSRELVDEDEPKSAYLSTGYLTYLAAVTVVRR